jgi:hypothetical protein
MADEKCAQNVRQGINARVPASVTDFPDCASICKTPAAERAFLNVGLSLLLFCLLSTSFEVTHDLAYTRYLHTHWEGVSSMCVLLPFASLPVRMLTAWCAITILAHTHFVRVHAGCRASMH